VASGFQRGTAPEEIDVDVREKVRAGGTEALLAGSIGDCERKGSGLWA
jgi:hypothetical protein